MTSSGPVIEVVYGYEEFARIADDTPIHLVDHTYCRSDEVEKVKYIVVDNGKYCELWAVPDDGKWMTMVTSKQDVTCYEGTNLLAANSLRNRRHSRASKRPLEEIQVPGDSGHQPKIQSIRKKHKAKKERPDTVFTLKVIDLYCTEPNCDVILHSRGEMTKHLLVDHNLGSFQCYANGCGERFNKSTCLGYHIKEYHATITKWPCPYLGCTSFSISQAKMALHVTRFHKPGIFGCGVKGIECPFTGTRQIDVFNHQRRDHLENPNYLNRICAFSGCGRQFRHPGELLKHEQGHCMIKPYLCDLCGYASQHRFRVVHHIGKVHKKLKPNEHILIDKELFKKPTKPGSQRLKV